MNVHDYQIYQEGPWGVGYALLSQSSFDPEEVQRLTDLASLRRNYHGDGVVFLDVGANVGVMSIEVARHMTGWGEVYAFEAQERIFYALAGNIAINNCFNARANFCAVGAKSGRIDIPRPDYTRPSNYGALELIKNSKNEPIGQSISYDPQDLTNIPMVALDDFDFPRVDLMKIDVERMELDVLQGSENTIRKFHPIIHLETKKSDKSAIDGKLIEAGYSVYDFALDSV